MKTPIDNLSLYRKLFKPSAVPPSTEPRNTFLQNQERNPGKLIGGYDDLIDYDRAGELDWRLGLAPRPKVGIFQTIIRYLRGQRY